MFLIAIFDCVAWAGRHQMLGLLAGAATLAEEAHFNLFPQQLQPPPSLPLRQKASKKKKRCGECPGCMMEEDCNVCKYCLDKPKLGGSNTLRRQCVQQPKLIDGADTVQGCVARVVVNFAVNRDFRTWRGWSAGGHASPRDPK